MLRGVSKRFDKRVVVVTGGSLGIGEGCSRLFCREGGRVAVLSRRAEIGEALVEELNAAGPGQAVYFPCDVSRHEQLRDAIEKTVQHFGRLDCLINNAGWHPPATTIDETDLDDLEDLLRLNFVSTVAGTKYAVPHLRKTKGTIINISSMVAEVGQDRSSAYCGTKGAQIGFTRALAVELGKEGIRVNAIAPGNVDTPLMREWADTLDDPETALARVSAKQLHGRMGTSEEIATIALFLATDDSSFMTGQVLHADFGCNLGR